MSKSITTRKEMYEAVVSVVSECGQGISYIFLTRELKELAQELIDEGVCKKVTIPFNHLPDDHFLCLSKGYCVEEERGGNLGFLRYYKNIPEEGPFQNLDVWFKKEKGLEEKYNEWLKQNKEQIDLVKTLKYEEQERKPIVKKTEKDFQKEALNLELARLEERLAELKRLKASKAKQKK